MTISQHAGQRVNQRGIPRRLVEFALKHGRIEGDRRVLDRREAQRLLDELQEELCLAKRVLDKGGVTVVESAGKVVTTYNVAPSHRKAHHPENHHG